jgi:hypothetical protein
MGLYEVKQVHGWGVTKAVVSGGGGEYDIMLCWEIQIRNFCLIWIQNYHHQIRIRRYLFLFDN